MRERHLNWVTGLVVVILLATQRAVAGEAIDPARGTTDTEQVTWYDLQLLDLEGRGWTETQSLYDRLPTRAEKIVRPEIWRLSRQASGICARFVTNATTLRVQWNLGLDRLSEANMTATAISGLDLYVKHDGQWRWLAIAKPESRTNSATLFTDIPAGEREFLIYLPLYNVVTSIKLGLPAVSKLSKAIPYDTLQKPIVVYGTSITQGGCVSRPGMTYSAILGRRFNRPVINLGFRANGTMDAEMVQFFAELDAAVYVLDCLPNMTAVEITQRVEPFVTTLRKTRPTTPILLAEDRTYPNGILDIPRRDRNITSRQALKTAFERLQMAGTKNLYYLRGEHLISDDGEATVDNSHPTDLGHMQQANAFEAALRPLLRPSQ